MNMDLVYTTSKSDERCRYENITGKDTYQNEIKRMVIVANNHESFSVDIGDNGEIQYAFTKVLKYIGRMKSDEWSLLVYGYNMNGKCKIFQVYGESSSSR